jgi:hypothetical protein
VVFSRNNIGGIVQEGEYERLLNATVQQIKALGQDHAALKPSSAPATHF